jgi:hypothetical protein
LSDERFTANPPASAGAPSVTVPVDEAPPVSDAGLTAAKASVGATGLIVSGAVFVTAAAVAVIVAVVTVPTAVVVTMNVAVVAPWATVTFAGTFAAALLLDRFTTKPPAGAALERVTVPVEEVPPVTVVGLSETFERAGGLMMRVAVFVTPAAVAVIVAVVTVPTAVVVTVKVAVVVPWATVTFAGTLAAALLLVRFTMKPPAGAALESVAVPVEEVPPVTVIGLRETFERAGGLIARGAVVVTPAAVAVMVAVVTVPTATVVTVKVAVVAPWATVTLVGTVASALSDERFTANPPTSAGAPRVTVPVDEAPPVSDVGLSTTETRASTGGLIVSAAVFVTPAAVAVIVAVVAVPTAVVETVNVAVVAP